ncbi:CDP-alcohol phosphatidyltransferase-domain-containing protein [Aspergillus aurantiobrunneus]
MPPRTATNRQENVFMFIPNLIGYFRVVFAIASLYYMPYHPRTCSPLYSISCLLDALDGAAARFLNQSTRFGTVLDMVTDRCTTTCLLVFLASAFPRWSIVFQGLISLDFSSHYIHMYATLAVGDKRSHKEVDERCFIALYLLAFTSSDPNPSIEGWFSLRGAGAMELARANTINSFWSQVLFSASLPFMLYKQYVNGVQLVQASKWIVQGDIEARRRNRFLRKREE